MESRKLARGGGILATAFDCRSIRYLGGKRPSERDPTIRRNLTEYASFLHIYREFAIRRDCDQFRFHPVLPESRSGSQRGHGMVRLQYLPRQQPERKSLGWFDGL